MNTIDKLTSCTNAKILLLQQSRAGTVPAPLSTLITNILVLSCLAFRVGEPDGRVGKASAQAEAAGARCE